MLDKGEYVDPFGGPSPKSILPARPIVVGVLALAQPYVGPSGRQPDRRRVIIGIVDVEPGFVSNSAALYRSSIE